MAESTAKILVIDRSPARRRMLFKQLEKAGYSDVEGASTPQRGLRMCEETPFDLVITAWNKGFKSFLSALNVRAGAAFGEIPLMLLGNRTMAERDSVIESIRAGVADFVAHATVVGDRVKRILDGTLPERELDSQLIRLLPHTLPQDTIDILMWDDPNEMDVLMERLKEEREQVELSENAKLMMARLGKNEEQVEGDTKTLSKEEIEKLERNTAERKIRPVPKPKPIITYDFKHPQRVSKDQQRTLENLHSNLARMTASSFSTIQRSIVDCDIAFVDQTTYAEFIMSLSNPSCSYTFSIEPLGGPAIIDFSLPVAYSFIDRQFGGTGENPPKEGRPLTAIERTVMGKILTKMLADLEATWEALLKIQVSDAELETNPEFMQMAAPSDTVILIAFEVNSQHASGLVTLCYPYFTLEPVMSYLNIRTWAGRGRSRPSAGRRQKRLNQLKNVPTPITAVWGKGTLSTEEVADLKEGDTIILDTRTDDPGTLFVGDQPLFQVRPGANEKDRYAVEILNAIPQEEAGSHV
ncbi:MAG: flagellar motor switch protein FliM [bacterium]|nr:flagellar motor switch protein FliM [bacterium]